MEDHIIIQIVALLPLLRHLECEARAGVFEILEQVLIRTALKVDRKIDF